MYRVRSGSAPWIRTVPNPFVHVLKFLTVSQIDADAASECKGVIVIGAIGPYRVLFGVVLPFATHLIVPCVAL